MADVATLTAMLRLQGVGDANRGLRDFQANMRRAATGAGEVGRSLLALSAPLIAFGALGVRAFADFETRMVRAGAVSNATALQLTQLENAARDMGRTTVFTASQSAEALSFLAMAGLSVENAIGALPRVLELAAAGQLELGQSADIVTNVMAGMQLGVEDLARANDVLVTAFTSANTDLTQLGQAFKFAGPVASAAGISFEETAASLALMGNAGIQASMAGTGLRGAITRLLNPSKEAAQVLQDLGISALTSEGRLRPMRDLIGDFEAVGLSAADALVLFGQRAGPAMLALISQGSGALETLIGRMEESGGTAERIAQAQLATFSGQMKIMRSAVEDVMITLGKGLVPIIRDMLNGIRPLVIALGGFIEQHPMLASVAVIAATAIAGLGVALVGLSVILPGLITIAPLVGAAITAMFGPVGVAVVAVGLLAAAFATNFLGIRDTVMSVWRTVKDIFNSWVGWLLPAGPLIKGLIAVKDNWDTIWQAIKTTIQGFTDAFRVNVNLIIKGLNLFGAGIEPLRAQVTKLSESVIEAKQALDPMMTRGLMNVSKALGATVRELRGAGDELAANVIPEIEQTVPVLDAMGRGFGELGQDVQRWKRIMEFRAEFEQVRLMRESIGATLGPVEALEAGLISLELSTRLHADAVAAQRAEWLTSEELLASHALGLAEWERTQQHVNLALEAMPSLREMFAEGLLTQEQVIKAWETMAGVIEATTDALKANQAAQDAAVPPGFGGIAGIPAFGQTPVERWLNALGGMPTGGYETIRRLFGEEAAAPYLNFGAGGTVPGPLGAPQLAVVHGGETVVPAGRSGSGGITFNATFTGNVYGVDDIQEQVLGWVSDGIRRGGLRELVD